MFNHYFTLALHTQGQTALPLRYNFLGNETQS
jgi:hypothetical protein